MSAITTRRRPLAALAAERAWAPHQCAGCGPQAKFGLAGIVERPTLRLSAANMGHPDDMPACQVRLGFADIEGRAIGDPDISDLRPGEGTFVDLEAAAMGDPGLREGGRVELRPVALGGPDTRGCRLVFTAQIFGPGGNKTEVLIVPSEPG